MQCSALALTRKEVDGVTAFPLPYRRDVLGKAMIGELSTIQRTDPTPAAACDTNLTFATADDAATRPDAKKVPDMNNWSLL